MRRVYLGLLLLSFAALIPQAFAAAPYYGPNNVGATSVSPTEVDLAWDPVAVTPDVTGYMIERQVNGNGFTTIVADTGTTVTGYQDTSLSPGITVQYRVSAINDDGVGPGALSNTTAPASPNTAGAIENAPLSLGATAVSGQEIDLSWTAPDASVTGYRIERGTGGSFDTIVANTNSAATTYNDTNLSPGVLYFYRVSAYNAAGPGFTSPIASAMTFTLPFPPDNVRATPGNGKALISWRPSTMTGGAPLIGYLVSYGHGNDFATSTAAGTSSSIVIARLTNGQPYTFEVQALNPLGGSAVVDSNTIVPSSLLADPQQPSGAASTNPSTAPGSAPRFIFATNLSLGMRSAAVQALQQRLTSEGVYSGPVTGYFGQLTKAAVKAYQNARGVSATGFVGPLTRATLNGS